MAFEGSDLAISLAFGRAPPVGCSWKHDHRASHAGDGGGCGRSSAMSRSSRVAGGRSAMASA